MVDFDRSADVLRSEGAHRQALDTAALDCIMLQRTNTESRVLHRLDAARLT
jgi:hypothetical protein